MSQTSGGDQIESPDRGLPAALCRALAGLDTGLVGASALLAWFALGSHLAGGLWFSRLNLAAAPFYGDLVFSSGAGWHTAVGAAHILIIYSLLGAAYGLLPASREGWLNLLTALGFAGLVHLCADAWVWKRLHPFAHPYYAPLAVAPGHLIYGLFLWRFPSRLQRIAALLGSSRAIASITPPPPLPEIESAAGLPEPAQTHAGPMSNPSFDPEKDGSPEPPAGAAPTQSRPESPSGLGSPPPSSLE